MISENYCWRILPIVRHEIDLKPHLIFMRDNVHFPKAAGIIRELDRFWISQIFWIVFSSELNPIESLWNVIKDNKAMRRWEEETAMSRQGRRSPISLQSLPEISQEAREIITSHEILSSINSMPRRCQAVINVGGSHIPYSWYILEHISYLYIYIFDL